MPQVEAQPYAFPYDGDLDPAKTAVILIDMQVDFCGHGGYVDQMGYDVNATRAPIAPLQRILKAARRTGCRIIHTREGHRPSLADLPQNKRWRSAQICGGSGGIGTPGPCGRVLVRGEPGWDIIPELLPLPHEDVIDKCGKGSFHATDLEMILRTTGTTTLLLGGITTDVCVHTTMREGNDRGFECCLITDGTGATDPSNHLAAHKMVTMQHGVFGCIASSEAILKVLDGLPTNPMKLRPAWPQRPFRPLVLAPPGNLLTNTIAEAKPFPYSFLPTSVALLMIDWQNDFLDPRGFGASLGNDVTSLRRGVDNAKRLLELFRSKSLTIAHTLEAHARDLSDVHPAKKRRCPKIGEQGELGRVLVKGEAGNDIIDELQPRDSEIIIHKPGKGAFYATNLEAQLRSAGCTHLIMTGVTTEVCVQSTAREANDRGFEVLVVSDATESYIPAFKEATLEMIVSQGGIVGWTAETDAVVKALAS